MATNKQITRTALKLADAAANIATLASSLVSMLTTSEEAEPAAAPKTTRAPKAAAAPAPVAKKATKPTVKADADVEVRTLSKKQYLELKGRRGRKSAADTAAIQAYEAANGIGEAPAAAPKKTAKAEKPAAKVNAVAAAPVKKASKKEAAAPAPAAKKAGKKVDTKSFSFDDGDDR